jgi:TM2 domain-containing membrane protein YozV
MSEYTPPSGPNPQSFPPYGSPPPPRGPITSPTPPMVQPPMSEKHTDVSGKKIAAGICGILLGSLGIHKFILGYTGAGIIMLLVTILSVGILSFITGLIGIIEGIIYLTKSDSEFYQTYVANKKSWF